MKNPETNDVLARPLDDWSVAPPRNPQFRIEAWTRIERAGKTRSWLGYVRSHLALTAGLAAVALAAGGWMGREQAKTQADLDRAKLAENYVRALDARTMRMP